MTHKANNTKDQLNTHIYHSLTTKHKTIILWEKNNTSREKSVLNSTQELTAILQPKELSLPLLFLGRLKNHQLFLKQKQLLDRFLETGAISKAQHDQSLHDIIEKMGEENEADD